MFFYSRILLCLQYKTDIFCIFQSHKMNDEGDNENILSRSESRTLIVDEDNAYAVFVTYIEIYNNSVYDLLEDTEGKVK